MSDPKFVRLADHLSRGMRADLNSGFSIAGLDVVPMPDKEDEPNRYAYVKRELASGRMEAASKAEYEEVHPDVLDSLGVRVERATVVDATPVQESQIQREAAKARRKLLRGREDATATEAALEADEDRRKAAIKAQTAKGGKARAKAAAEAEEADAAAAAAAAEAGGAEDEDTTQE